ncbi:MAG TPA: DegV family protein [Mycobacteriales bacterium]|nr:DegV family protein [Mycobacteriales bacterium]
MPSRVAIVTDSSASLSREMAVRWRVTVIPLRLLIKDWVGDDNEVKPEAVTAAMRDGVTVATSPPPPPAFYWAYQDAIASGANAIVSVHLSEKLSATADAARTAAGQVRVPVHVVDSRTAGMSLGFAAAAAADAAQSGAGPDEVLAVIGRRLSGCLQLVYVDTLEYLRRGGRMGAARAWLGSTLGIKPVLVVKDGQVTPFERIRGTDKALARMVEVARGHAGGHLVDIAVEHCDAANRAMALAEQLRRSIPRTRSCYVIQAGMAVAAHTGPGSIGVAVSRC